MGRIRREKGDMPDPKKGNKVFPDNANAKTHLKGILLQDFKEIATGNATEKISRPSFSQPDTSSHVSHLSSSSPISLTPPSQVGVAPLIENFFSKQLLFKN